MFSAGGDAIVAGTAKGLLYLPENLLKIIHRVLKTSNMFLDNEMNPTILNFGMAKFFEAKESKTNTNGVV